MDFINGEKLKKSIKIKKWNSIKKLFKRDKITIIFDDENNQIKIFQIYSKKD